MQRDHATAVRCA